MSDSDAPPPRRPDVFSLVGALAVVLGFFAVTIIAQHYAQVIDRLTEVLGTNAMPSIDHLTAARGALHRSGIAARDLARGETARRLQDCRALDNARRLHDREMAAYLDLPFFPGERAQAQSALKDSGAYERVLDKLVGLVDSGDLEGARGMLVEELTPANDREDAAIERLVQLNADHGIRTSQAIQRARVRATQLSYLLHVLAGALALLVLWGVARARRSYERAVEARARLDAERKRLAEERAAELDMFAARVAHDLMNPLAAATMSVSVLDRQLEDPQKARVSLARMSRAHGAMQRIIDGLLAFARTAGSAEGTSTDLAETLKDALADVAPAIDRAGVTVSIDRCGPVRVACAAGPLLSVLENLLANAAKYIVATPPDTRRIQVRIVDGKDVVRVEVDDTGPGIPSEAQKDIFDPYVRGRKATQPGLGLGLATVKRIVEAHGGAVGVRSVVGAGSCFWFELPSAAPPAEKRARLQLN